MRIFVSIRCSSAPAFGKEETEDLNALFADIVEATHKSGSKGLFKGFRKKWNSFIATLNTCATILLLLFLPFVLFSLAVVSYFDAFEDDDEAVIVNNWNSKECFLKRRCTYIYISPLNRQTGRRRKTGDYKEGVYYVRAFSICTNASIRARSFSERNLRNVRPLAFYLNPTP